MPLAPLRLAGLGALLSLAAAVAAQPVTVAIDATALPDSLRDATLGLRGDTAPLAWDRSTPLLDADGDGVYTASLAFPDGAAPVAYKAVLQRPDGTLVWEPGENRLLVPARMTQDLRAFGAPQTDLPVRTVSQAQLAQDVGLLRTTLQALHPGLTLHNSLADLEALSNRLGADVRALGQTHGEAIPVPAAYLPIARAVAGLRDGHTQVSMYNQGGYLEAMLYTAADRVPFAFRLVEGRMIVTGDATPDQSLPIGTEILTLDGRPVADVLEAMMPYVSADGANDAKRIDQLEVNALPAPAERFDVLYALLFAPEGDLTLTARSPDGVEASHTVARTTQDVRRARLREREAVPRSDADRFTVRLDDDGTATLSIGSFATFNLDIDYDAWLIGAFRDLNARGAKRLVVDLRGVAGGMDAAAALLLRHLLSEPVEVSFWHGVTAYDVVPEALRPHLRSWTSDYLDLRDRVTPAGDGTFRLAARPPITLPPAPDAFAGPTAVLVDATASSATFYLAQQIQATGAALLVGQETGGSLKGLNAGQMVFLTLPHTGIVVDVPLYGSRPSTPERDGGVIPDVVVPPSAEAVVAGRDLEAEAAVEALTRGTPMRGDPGARPAESATGDLDLRRLVGDWTGTLVYTEYRDDATRVTLPIVAEASWGRDDRLDAAALRLDVVFTEPDGSPGGRGTTVLAVLDDATTFGYDGEAWTVRERAVEADGFRIVLEASGQDNNRPATIRHTIAYRDGVLIDRKEVRYDGADAFLERNVFTLTRP